MAWFKKVAQDPCHAKDDQPVPEGLWEKCPTATRSSTPRTCRRTSRSATSAATLPDRAIDALKSLFDDERWDEIAHRAAVERSADLHRHQAVSATGSRRRVNATGQTDASSSASASSRHHHRHRLDGVQLHRRIDGRVVGEKIVRGIELALGAGAGHHRLVLGGARMMEGAPLADADGKDLRGARPPRSAALPYFSCSPIRPPAASPPAIAMLGDLNIAEPRALIGFAGPRVIEQTIRQKLPDGFQRSEFLLERGMLDPGRRSTRAEDDAGPRVRFMQP
jgi:acetyl-CoA carboxylase carboxyl transferase subunit beta